MERNIEGTKEEHPSWRTAHRTGALRTRGLFRRENKQETVGLEPTVSVVIWNKEGKGYVRGTEDVAEDQRSTRGVEAQDDVDMTRSSLDRYLDQWGCTGDSIKEENWYKKKTESHCNRKSLSRSSRLAGTYNHVAQILL